MNSFFISKRKGIELLILFILSALFYFLWNSWDFILLFSLGYIWNWVASQEETIVLDNKRRYRFSTLKLVFNLQRLIQKPFLSMPEFTRIIARSLPAGLFWSAVILFNESQMPWWGVFLGSLVLELIQIEKKFFQPKEA